MIPGRKTPSLNSISLAGTLSASPRFGALPKVACKSKATSHNINSSSSSKAVYPQIVLAFSIFLKYTLFIWPLAYMTTTPAPPVAGFCGYLAGKMSYMKTCQEKFKRLENSPLGEALRQRTGLPQQ